MSEMHKKTSDRVLINKYDGKEIKDELGRTLRLRKPDILDEYDMWSAIGADAVKNPMCVSYAISLLHVATVDNLVIQTPLNMRDFRAELKKVGKAGIDAINKYMAEAEEEISDQETTEKVKK